MVDFDVIKNISFYGATVLCVICTFFVSFKLSIKNKTAPVGLYELVDIFSLVRGWFGAFELLPVAGKSRTGMKCHQVADSLISTSSGFRDYGGFLNLGMLLLIIANSRVALENVLKYGILISPMSVIHTLSGQNGWPSLLLIAGLILYPSITYCSEYLIAHNHIGEKLNLCVIIVNGFMNVMIPAYLVISEDPHPIFSMFLLTLYVVVFLKLISYSMVQYWCRNGYPTEETSALTNGSANYTGSTSADEGLKMKEFPKQRKINPRKKTKTFAALDDALTDCSEHEIDDSDIDKKILDDYCSESIVQYPNNINRGDFLYYLVAPTLCYELNFPRSSRIRKRFLIRRILESLFLIGFIIAGAQQWILPTVENSLIPFIKMEYSLILERLLKLAVPNCFLWLLMFYLLFHSFLNILGELLMFGDRNFYQDWWNATTISQFWKQWNIPVHKWATRHVYKPMLRCGFTPFWTSATVFFLSAFFHEYLVSVPLGLFTLWAAGGMMAQVPLKYLLDHTGILNERMANMVVWGSIIFGQPMAILAYYHDYYLLQRYNVTIPLLYAFQNLSS